MAHLWGEPRLPFEHEDKRNLLGTGFPWEDAFQGRVRPLSRFSPLWRAQPGWKASTDQHLSRHIGLRIWEHPLAKYSVEWQEGEEHQSKLRQIGNPRLFDHPYQSPQLELWPSDQVEWFVIIQAHPYGSRPRRKRTARLVVMQPPLLTDGTQG